MKSDRSNARLIAFYLPQFHPIPENDAWWGKGFTEWTNVAQARPLFRGHYQPHIPADLGFYDLRLKETRLEQAAMAKAYGIEGFCYWHYWYGSRQLLESPFEEMLISGEPNFPFCMAWANHSWTRAWVGKPDDVLIEQIYPGVDDHKKHFEYLLPAFCDNRYLTVEEKPIFVIMRPTEIPNVRQLTDLWRELALKAGLKGLHIIGFRLTESTKQNLGFDATTFPNHRAVEKVLNRRNWWRKIISLHSKFSGKPIVIQYRDAIPHLLKNGNSEAGEYPCIYPNWDSTPRYGKNGFVLHGSTPRLFKILVRRALEQVCRHPQDRNIVFIKSWNEWAEGNHLEPDLKFGKAYLKVLRKELFEYRRDLNNISEN